MKFKGERFEYALLFDRGVIVMAPVELSYYYGYEAEQFSFYRIPKLLFTDSRFAGISTDAKLLYGVLLDHYRKNSRGNGREVRLHRPTA